MYRSISILVSLSVICLLLAACGGSEPTPAPPPATATAVATVAEPTAAPAETPTAEAPAASSEVTTTEEMTSTEEAAPSEEMTSTEETTSTEEMAPSEEMTSTEETTSSDEMTSTEEVAPSEDMSSTEETEEVAPVTETEEVTATTETTETSSSESAPAEAAAPDNTPIKVVSARQVTDVLNENYPYFVTLSPDGSSIAYATQHRRDRSLCIYTFANADVICTTPPEEFENYPYALQWSPDSKLIAFTENPLQLGNESDIWIYDVAAGTTTDITDDGVNGYYSQDTSGSYALDYLPMWNKADGMLYFWRSVPNREALTSTRVLMKIDPSGGDPEEVRDLTTETGQDIIYFDSEYWFLDGVSDLSPDGTKVAALVTAPMDPYESPTNGLWLADITSDAAPQQLMTIAQFQSAAAPFLTLPSMPVGLSWTGDGNGLIAAAFSNDTHAPLLIFYYIDISTGDVTPIVDFSQVPDYETLYSEVDEAGLPMRYYAPWTAVMSPNRDKLLMYNDLGGVPGMLQASLPPDGSKPVAVYKGEYSSTGLSTRSSSASDGKVLIYGDLLTVEE